MRRNGFASAYCGDAAGRHPRLLRQRQVATLALQLGDRLGLPVVHLDPLYWRPEWQVPDPEGFLARVAEALALDAWISEGNYRETFEIRLPRADAVIALERSRWLCLWRVVRRGVFARGRRPDLPAGCREKTDWALLKFIWRFDRVTWPRHEAARAAIAPEKPIFRLRSEREIRRFLAQLPEAPPSPAR